MKKHIALFHSLLLVSAVYAQKDPKGLQLTACHPDEVRLRSSPDSGTFVFLTLTGERLGAITNWRITRSGVPETGLTAQQQVLEPIKPPKGKAAVPAYDAEKNRVVKITVARSITDGEFALEAFANKQWTKAPVRIMVGRAGAVRIPLPPERELSVAEQQLANAKKLEGLRKATATDHMLVAPAPSPVMQHLNAELENAKGSGYTTANIVDYYPKEQGQLEGYLVLIGTHLDSIKDVKIGNTRLGRVHKKLHWNGYQKYVYYIGAQLLTGPLVVVKPFKLGKRVSTYEQVLEDNYAVVKRSALLTKVTVLDVRPFEHTGNKIYPEQQLTLHVRLENVPGNYFQAEELERIGYYSRNVIVKGKPLIDADEEFGEGNRIYYGNMFELYFTCRAIDDPEFLTANIHFIAKDLNATAYYENLTLHLALPLSSRQEYVIENTASLKHLLDFGLTSSWGSAEGTSYGPNPFGDEDDLSVGPMVRNDDLAFRIASGPIGTKGEWTSNALKLKDGWTVESITSSRTVVDPDRWSAGVDIVVGYVWDPIFALGRLEPVSITVKAGEMQGALHFYVDRCITGCTEDRVIGRFCGQTSLESWSDGIKTSWENDPMDLYMRPLSVHLELDKSLINDHRITMVLESIKLKGPEGADVTEAFERGILEPMDYPVIKGDCDRDTNDPDITPIHSR